MSDDTTPPPPQPSYGSMPPAPPLSGQPDASPAGFFKALFDFSFTTFVTPKVVKFVYALSAGLLVLGWLIFLIGGFNDSAGAGLFVLIVGPIIGLLYLLFIRMGLEFSLAIVRMSEDINRRLPRP